MRALSFRSCLSLALIILSGCSLLSSMSKKGLAPARDPSGVADSYQLYKDYLEPSALPEGFKNKVHLEFHTTMDEEHLRSGALHAFRAAVNKTLDTDGAGDAEESNEQTGASKLIGKFKENLVDELLREFVLGLQVLKIINGAIQVDFHFLPEEDSPTQYDRQLDSNQLVRLSHTGSLAQAMAQTQKPWTMKYSEVANRIQEQPTRGHQVFGGTISLWIRILKPMVPFKKNVLQGFVRYRRYFLHEQMAHPQFINPKADFKVTGGRMVAAPSAPVYYTVDIYKTFDATNIAPRLDSMDIYPGRIEDVSFGRPGLSPKRQEGHMHSHQNSSFYFTGHHRRLSKKSEITFKVEKISYDFSKNKLSAKNSILTFENSRTDTDLNHSNAWVAHSFFNDYRGPIMNYFGLHRFWHDLER